MVLQPRELVLQQRELVLQQWELVLQPQELVLQQREFQVRKVIPLKLSFSAIFHSSNLQNTEI